MLAVNTRWIRLSTLRPVANDLVNDALRLDNEPSALAATCLLRSVSKVQIPGGGYSLCDGWYICAAVLTPFFHFGRIEHDLLGVFFSSTNSKAIFWGTKTTNFYKNRSFWPQIQFFPRSFWVQFSAASGTPPSVFRPSTPPPRGTNKPHELTESFIKSQYSMACILSSVVRIQLKILHDINKCVLRIVKFGSDTTSHFSAVTEWKYGHSLQIGPPRTYFLNG